MKSKIVAVGVPLIFTGLLTIAQVTESILIPDDAHSNHGFGYSVAIDSSCAVVGTQESIEAAHSGSAYVFRKDGDTWKQEQKFTPDMGEHGGDYGWSVAVQGNDILIGEPNDSESGMYSGAVYHYEYIADSMTWYFKVKIMAEDEAVGDNFGEAISISGDFAIIGAGGVNGVTNNDGAAYIYQMEEGDWIEKQKLLPSGIAGESYFGSSVCIDGDHAIVGSYADDEKGKDAGAAYLFHRNGDVWEMKAKLFGSDTDGSDKFGFSVAISGEYAAASAISVFGTCGVVYVFKYNISEDQWVEIARLTDPEFDNSLAFGYGISMEGEYLLASMRHDNTGVSNGGSLYIYKRVDEEWTLIRKIYASDGVESAQLGYSVALYGDNILAGAPMQTYNDPPVSSGGAYIYSGYRGTGTFIFPVSKLNRQYLLQNDPNPFSIFTKITYRVPLSGKVSIVLYDLMGRKINSLVDAYHVAGEYNLGFYPGELPSGIYFYALMLDGECAGMQKMIIKK